jgi:hypothetical protein
MKFKNIIFLVIILLIVLLIISFFIKKPAESPVIEIENEQTLSDISVYVDQNGEALSISYNLDNTANLIIDQENSILFTATTSDEGMKYENISQGLVLLNKDKTIYFYLNDSLIYQGNLTE